MTDDGIPPQDRDAEEGVLGAALLAPRGVAVLLDVLRPHDHYLEAHRAIHPAIARLAQAGSPIDPITVCDELASTRLADGRDALSVAGGRGYVHGLVSLAVVSHAERHAQIVRKNAQRRNLLRAALELARAAQSGDDPDAVLAEHDLRVAEIASGVQRASSRVKSLAEISETWAAEVLEDAASGGGMRTGWPTIDAALGVPIRRGEVIGLAARTAVGKTWAALHIGAHVASHITVQQPDAGVLFCSLEMPGNDIYERVAVHTLDEEDPAAIVAGEPGSIAGAWFREMRRPDEWNASHVLRRLVTDAGSGAGLHDMLLQARPYLDRWRVVDGQISLVELPRLIAETRRQGNPANVVVVDYLGLLRWDGRKSASTYEQVSETARALKAIAIRERVCLLVCLQLNRSGKDGERPTLAMLRDSGATEEAMDRVIAVWNPSDASDLDNDALRSATRHMRRACLLKNRKGSLGDTADLTFTFGQRLVELAPDDYR